MPLCKECRSDLPADAMLCLNCGAFTGVIAPKAVAAQITLAPEGATKTFPSTPKSKPIAGVLALLLAPFGAHHFYLGGWGWGAVQLALFVMVGIFGGSKSAAAFGAFVVLIWLTFAIIAFIRAFIFFFGSQTAFDQKYNHTQPGPFTW